MTWNKDYGFLSLSEKTRMSTVSNNLQVWNIKQHINIFYQLHVLNKDPEYF